MFTNFQTLFERIRETLGPKETSSEIHLELDASSNSKVWFVSLFDLLFHKLSLKIYCLAIDEHELRMVRLRYRVESNCRVIDANFLCFFFMKISQKEVFLVWLNFTGLTECL